MTTVFPRPEATDVPPLENGDCLTTAEFMRRYEAMPANVKAELINGVVSLASPVSRRHGVPHLHLGTWLGAYLSSHPELEGGDNTTVLLEEGDVPQPDLYLRRVPPGADADATYVEGAPELVIEVAASSASIDMNQKKEMYRRNRAEEYLLWRTRDAKVDWWRLDVDRYVAIEPDATGVIESRHFPGLRLDVPALLRGDLAAVLAGLKSGS